MEPSQLSQPALPPIPAPTHRWALFLDFDTCFSTLEDGSAGVSITPESRYTLIRLFHAFGGAVALLTNRSLLETDQMVGLPDLPIAARNGLELRSLRKSAAAPIYGCPGLPRAALIDALMGAAPFSGRQPVILSGSPADDSAFENARSLAGFGIRIGQAPLQSPYRLQNARAARALLGEWASYQQTWTQRASA